MKSLTFLAVLWEGSVFGGLWTLRLLQRNSLPERDCSRKQCLLSHWKKERNHWFLTFKLLRCGVSRNTAVQLAASVRALVVCYLIPQPGRGPGIATQIWGPKGASWMLANETPPNPRDAGESDISSPRPVLKCSHLWGQAWQLLRSKAQALTAVPSGQLGVVLDNCVTSSALSGS